MFRPFCVGGVWVSLAVQAQKRGRYFTVKTVQSQAKVMLASLVKTRFMQASILSELRDEQVTRHAMDSGRGSFDSVDRFLKNFEKHCFANLLVSVFVLRTCHCFYREGEWCIVSM